MSLVCWALLPPSVCWFAKFQVNIWHNSEHSQIKIVSMWKKNVHVSNRTSLIHNWSEAFWSKFIRMNTRVSSHVQTWLPVLCRNNTYSGACLCCCNNPQHRNLHQSPLMMSWVTCLLCRLAQEPVLATPDARKKWREDWEKVNANGQGK